MLQFATVLPKIPRAKMAMAAVPAKVGDVNQFMLGGVTKGSKSDKVSWVKLYVRYRAWCLGKKGRSPRCKGLRRATRCAS